MWLCGIGNIWSLVNAGSSVTAGTAAYAATSGTALYAGVSGTASFAGTASYAATSGFAGTASVVTAFVTTPTPCSASQYASGISTVGNLTCSIVSTASTTGTAAFAGLAGTASITTAFATTPNPCSAGQYASGISTTGNLTCSQVNYSNLTGTFGIPGSTSGTISLTAISGTYNFVLPTTVGTAGQVLTSGGGGTAPMTWQAGALSNPMTTSQDLIVGGASGTPTRLAVGNTFQHLTINSGGTVAWTNITNLNHTALAAGSTTWTVPAGVTNGTLFRFLITGGSGGGGGALGLFAAASGGGGGGTCVLYKAGFTAGATYAYTIGNGGNGGTTAGSNGTAGVNTTISLLGLSYIGYGGSPGTGSTVTATINSSIGGGGGTAGGTGTCSYNYFGNPGYNGIALTSANAIGGGGGGTVLSGNSPYVPAGSAGQQGVPGQGGSGGASNSATVGQLGGSGGAGEIDIEWVE